MQQRGRLARTIALLCAGGLLLAGCGTRADQAEILAGAGGGPATLAPSDLDQVRAAVGATGGSGAYSSTLTITPDGSPDPGAALSLIHI